MKNVVRRMFAAAGLDVRRASSIPFGDDWRRDVRFFSNGRDIKTIFDVGANLGQTASAIAESFPGAQTYCFEPVPSTFEQLSRTVASLKNVTAVCSAMAEAEGSIRMTAKPLSVSNRIVVESDTTTDQADTVAVKVDTIDAFCQRNRIKSVNLLKIDTEGYELNVLRGARGMLADGAIDFILAECEFLKRPSEPHGSFLEILEFARPFGFNVVALYSGGVDDLGWVWGDVLLRRVSDSSAGRASVCPLTIPTANRASSL